MQISQISHIKYKYKHTFSDPIISLTNAFYSPDARHPRPEEVRSLVDAGADQHAAVGASLDGELGGAGVLVPHQPLTRRLEVREAGLQVGEAARVGPGLAILAPAADVGHGHDAKMLKYSISALSDKYAAS